MLFIRSFRLLLVFIVFYYGNIHSILFLNRHFIPEMSTNPLLSYRQSYQTITFQPFVMGAENIHIKNAYGFNESFRGIYELEGNYHATVINQSLVTAGVTNKPIIPSQWLYEGLFIPVNLGGKINATGFGWNIMCELDNNFFIGWSSAFCSVTGLLDLKIKTEDEKVPLSEGYINDVLDAYRSLNRALRNNGTHIHEYSLADQDLYIRYEWCTDFAAFMHRIKASLQAGWIPNPASFAVGTNGHMGFYGAAQLDLLLKEDITLGFAGKLISQTSKVQQIRLSLLHESTRYGSVIAQSLIDPGLTTIFSPYLSIEGLREGLGMKLAYMLAHHCNDTFTIDNNINLLSKTIIPPIDINRLNGLSGWAQEHVILSVFYDFMRCYEEHDMEPFLGFSVYIPIDWLFSKGSAKTLIHIILYYLHN